MPKEAELHEDVQKREQMEWERLQNEALAAQRYRLEQEIEQARAQGLISDDEAGQESFMGINWSNKWLLTGLVVFLVSGAIALTLLI